MNAIGPLSKVWKTREDTMNTKCKKVKITLEDLKECTEQTIVVLSQAYNSISYHRRLNILSTTMKEVKLRLRLR